MHTEVTTNAKSTKTLLEDRAGFQLQNVFPT